MKLLIFQIITLSFSIFDLVHTKTPPCAIVINFPVTPPISVHCPRPPLSLAPPISVGSPAHTKSHCAQNMDFATNEQVPLPLIKPQVISKKCSLVVIKMYLLDVYIRELSIQFRDSLPPLRGKKLENVHKICGCKALVIRWLA